MKNAVTLLTTLYLVLFARGCKPESSFNEYNFLKRSEARKCRLPLRLLPSPPLSSLVCCVVRDATDLGQKRHNANVSPVIKLIILRNYFFVALTADTTLSTRAMAESVSVHGKVNEINDSESETQSDGYHGTSDEEDTNHSDDNGETKKRPDQDRSQTPHRRKPNKKRARDEPEEEEADEGMKRDERRAANRLSAFQSRQRRKSIISDLQVR
jgi:hypothetical protein